MAEYEQSIAEVLKSAVRDAQDLVRTEIALAKSELRHEGRRLTTSLVLLAGAAVCAVLAAALLMSAIAWAVTTAMEWPIWAGFATVTAVMLLAACSLGLMGHRRLTGKRHLPMTMDTMKENAEWIRHRTSSRAMSA
jgi:uncharacterized membrane protein YqjE